MEAGRALDTLVAEQVMGTTPFRRDFCIECGAPKDIHVHIGSSAYSDEGFLKSTDYCIFEYAHRYKFDKIPYYSVSIEAAWLVVEKLRKRWAVELHGRDNAWCCLVEEGDEVTGHYIATSDADTAPLAICLAALKAMGVHVDETP